MKARIDRLKVIVSIIQLGEKVGDSAAERLNNRAVTAAAAGDNSRRG